MREVAVVVRRVMCDREQRQTRSGLLLRLGKGPDRLKPLVEVVLELMVFATGCCYICMDHTRRHRRPQVLSKEAGQVVEVGSSVLVLVELMKVAVEEELEVLRQVVEGVVRLVLRMEALAEERAAHLQEAVVLELARTGAEVPFQTVCAMQAVAWAVSCQSAVVVWASCLYLTRPRTVSSL
jgi:hypothetical protein